MSFLEVKEIKYLRIKEHLGLVLGILLLLLISIYIGVKVPFIITQIYESYGTEKFENFIYLGGVFFISQYMVRLIYKILMSFYVKSLIEKLREDLFSHWIFSQDKIIKNKKSYFSQDKYTRGEFQARIINDAEAVRELISSGSLTIFMDFFFILACMISFLSIHTFYGIVLIITEAFICVLLLWISKFMVHSFKEVRVSSAKLSRVLSSLSQGFKPLFYSKSEKYALNSATPKFENFLKVQLKANFWDASYYSFAESLFPILLVVVVLVYPYSHVSSVAIFAALLDLVQRSIGPIKNVASKVSNIQRAMTGIRRITELDNDLEKYSFKTISNELMQINSLNFSVENFEYQVDDKSFSLRKINANLTKGKKIGIIGKSGSGKSTILKLLSGDIFSDKILIDLKSINNSVTYRGMDLKDVNILRKYLCLVSQDSYLFSNTLEFNITFNNNKAEDFEKFWKLMQEKIPYVKTWNLKPDSQIILSEISLGQKQLISALRFCYQKKPIVLLDEISSALDGDLEQALSDFIDYIQDEVMMIIVAHRVETLIKCDEILFLDSGEQIALGPHDKLMKNYTDYANFFKMLKSE